MNSFFRKILRRGNNRGAAEDGRGLQYEKPQGVEVRVSNLNKSFGNHHVLKNIDFQVKPRETFAIIGPSGTGKSVLLKHIVKLIEPDSGSIFLNGEDIFKFKGHKLPYRCSMVFQSSALFNSLTVGENVGLWLRENRICSEKRIQAIIHEKLQLVGLAGKENLRTPELSGGMKKRVAIARSLAVNPDLILYDEPTAELDPVTSDELARVMKSLRKELDFTTIIVSHDLSFALYLSDRVAMLNQDGIVEIGTPDEIRESENPIVRNFIYTTTKGLKGE